ncbi:MAG TPA: YlxR family protein [Acidimicrobiales bacterium]|nr:YlxR family protein [Acidimicrobiales bacterium]
MGCRRTATPDQLVRLARLPTGELVVGRDAQGRGAWLCRSSVSCVERALRRGALSRALRSPVAPDQVEQLRALLTRVEGSPGPVMCEDRGSHVRATECEVNEGQ